MPCMHMVTKALTTSVKTTPHICLSSLFLLTIPKKRGQLQCRALSGSKSKLLVIQQPAALYFPEDPSE